MQTHDRYTLRYPISASGGVEQDRNDGRSGQLSLSRRHWASTPLWVRMLASEEESGTQDAGCRDAHAPEHE